MENKDLDFDYKYGFHTETTSFKKSKKGLNEEVLNFISDSKGEDEKMRSIRLNAYKEFLSIKNPSFGPDLSMIDFDDYTYYIKPTEKTEQSWDDVPVEIKNTFEKLGIPEAEAKYLSGTSTQFESEVVYHKNLKELDDQGVIFCDTDTALKEHPEIFYKYFSKVIPANDNKYAALNTAVWSGGSFIYVPKGIKIDKPVQSYFRINSEKVGQFERTLIIVDDDASIHYVEGCTAPQYSKDSLHAAVVEIFVGKNAKCRYSTVQNWSNNIINLVTKRALVLDNGQMEWIDGNVGSMLNMKYPACILKGDNAMGTTVSIAYATEGMIQDTGCKMIHIGKNTKSNIISKSICQKGGVVNYRGIVSHEKGAIGARSHIECDTLILDDISKSDTIPLNIGKNNDMYIEHEATVSKIDENQLFYLMSRGLSEEDATNLIVMGFIEPFSKELPMEYAVELNRLIQIDTSNSIG